MLFALSIIFLLIKILLFELFEKGINNDYHNWWLEKTEDARKQEYIKSLRR